jgi:hypothetical protein
VPPLQIELSTGSEIERATRGRLDTLLRRYDLTGWYFTERVVVQEGIVPHSHPVLTIGIPEPRGTVATDDRLLARFVHEQLHWFVLGRRTQLRATAEVLRRLYPDPPIAIPEGAGSFRSTYLHLIVCTLEYLSLRHIIGESLARITLQEKGFYLWIYKVVLRDVDELSKMLRAEGLIPGALSDERAKP